MAFTLAALFGKNMVEMGLRAFEAALARSAKAFSRAAIGFKFRHLMSPHFMARHRETITSLANRLPEGGRLLLQFFLTTKTLEFNPKA